MEVGEYYYIQGLNASCPATVAAYVSRYISNRRAEVCLAYLLPFPSPSSTQCSARAPSITARPATRSSLPRLPLMPFNPSCARITQQNGSQVKARRCTICCYDMFAGRDIRIQVEFPGGLTSIRDADWGRACVSSTARALHCLHADLDEAPPWSSLLVRNPLHDSMFASAVCKALRKVICDAKGLRSSLYCLRAACPLLHNAVFQLIFDGLLAFQHLSEAEALCRHLSSLDVEGEAWAIEASLAVESSAARQMYDERMKAALLRATKAAVLSQLNSAPILALQSRLLCQQDHPMAAIATARRAYFLGSGHLQFVFPLCEAYMSAGWFRHCLAALNTVTPGVLLRSSPPASRTSLHAIIYQNWMAEARKPHRSTVKVPFQDDRHLGSLRGDSLPLALRPLYELLYRLMRAVKGWEALLRLRSQVFVHHKPRRSPRAPRSVVIEEAETQRSASRKPSFVTVSETSSVSRANGAGDTSDIESVLGDGSVWSGADGDHAAEPIVAERPVHLWLENLFNFLLDDLDAMTTHLPRGGRDAFINPKEKTKLDWYHLGRLCQRMDEPRLAYQCFEECQAFCKEKSSLRLKATLHLLALDAHAGNIEGFSRVLADLGRMTSEAAGDWRSGLARDRACTAVLHLAAKTSPTRVLAQLKSLLNDSQDQVDDLLDDVMTCLIRKSSSHSV
ncbi:uncharacterized protein MONBRDRAFT_32179 [Monosiga brevicollis MX1]|uniref:Uncharacterized protein n=1 Tax=Monosiga brevicollis TaxID=81824 RepID=A9UY52_MONBE|nr:uncharacterized protein MONBRDRAFT_32179 [Monosiga brevicollis MX1]EDQ89960.1 predicted protein [Monosiga brevicollis MX1]|eukprot:XP_001745382.1 hypothetical protein [Monosiga brevicollis MX1]